MKVLPLRSKILIKVDSPEKTTKSGIILPEVAQEKVNYASVIAVGPGTENEPMNLKVGDHIMFDKYAGTEIKIDGIEHLIINQKDVIAMIES